MPFSNANCIILLSVNIHCVVFFNFKMPQMLSKRKETLYQGERGCWGGGAGINKSHNSFQSLKTFFSLLSHVRFKHGRWGQDVYFANGVFANCRFYKLPPLFSVYVRYFKKRKKSSPSTLCISFFCFFFFFPPLPSFPPLSCAPPPCPVLCTHCSACSSGETEEIAVLLIR